MEYEYCTRIVLVLYSYCSYGKVRVWSRCLDTISILCLNIWPRTHITRSSRYSLPPSLRPPIPTTVPTTVPTHCSLPYQPRTSLSPLLRLEVAQLPVPVEFPVLTYDFHLLPPQVLPLPVAAPDWALTAAEPEDAGATTTEELETETAGIADAVDSAATTPVADAEAAPETIAAAEPAALAALVSTASELELPHVGCATASALEGGSIPDPRPPGQKVMVY
jgi:hypothetical protein